MADGGDAEALLVNLDQQRIQQAESPSKDGKENVEGGSSVEKLTKLQLAEYKEAFNLFDKDRNGTICTHELRNVMHALGQSPTDQEIQDMIACSDKDGSGNIDLNEFLHLMTSKKKSNLEEIRIAFKVMDKDGDGFISFADLKKTMYECNENLSDDDLQRMIVDADMDEDNRVCYTDHVAFPREHDSLFENSFSFSSENTETIVDLLKIHGTNPPAVTP